MASLAIIAAFFAVAGYAMLGNAIVSAAKSAKIVVIVRMGVPSW